MSTLDVATMSMGRAKRWLQGAERALEDGRWDDAVYSAQMCSEHAAKALLIAFGIDFPKQHDVSGVFLGPKERRDMSPELRSGIEDIAGILGELASERAMAGYGFEEGVDVNYFKDYAPDAVKKARMVSDCCAQALR